MKLIITERQYRLLIENENGINPDGELFEMQADIIPPSKWDSTFLRACKLEPGKYGGYQINGDVDLKKYKVDELKYLTAVWGNFDAKGAPLKRLDNLRVVTGYLNLSGTEIIDLGELIKVGEYLNLNASPIKSLPKLRIVGGDLDIRGTKINNTSELDEVGGTFFIGRSPMKKKFNEYRNNKPHLWKKMDNRDDIA